MATLRFLGTAGFVLEAQERTLVVDPYVTRASLATTLFGRLRPDTSRIRAFVPRADEVLCSHAHFDHVLDAPEVCRQTGARLLGSASVCNVGRAAGLPEAQLVPTSGGEDILCGPAVVHGIRSRHGKLLLGRVPLPGPILRPPPWPPRARDLRCGQVLCWHVTLPGLSVVHVGSANFLDPELIDHRCDVLCLCAIGWRRRPHYVSTALRLLRPKVVVPCHWDVFFDPIEARPRRFPFLDLDGFVAEVRSHGAEVVVLPPRGALCLDSLEAVDLEPARG